MPILIDVTETSRFGERNVPDEDTTAIPRGEALAGGSRVRIVLHMCNLRPPFSCTILRGC